MVRKFEVEGLEVEGHRGTWYNITEGRKYVINGKVEVLYLLEHETYGDEAAHVIANAEGKLFMEYVWNGWDDWYEYVLQRQGYNRADFPIKLDEPVSL
jgi:hypothetical protein